MPLVPHHLNDLKDSLQMGGPIRASDFLIRRRLEFLVEREDQPLGLRRAMHAAAIVEVLYRSVEKAPGFFNADLKQKLNHRLANSNPQPQESHFADIEWWKQLDYEAARLEMISNLARLTSADPTTCLAIGIEIHVLFDVRSRHRCGPSYASMIIGRSSSQTLRDAQQYFSSVLYPSTA